eukprot:5155919-Alexandrium_andersonii.AAC.1
MAVFILHLRGRWKPLQTASGSSQWSVSTLQPAASQLHSCRLARHCSRVRASTLSSSTACSPSAAAQ